MLKVCVCFAPIVKVTFDWVLTKSGRVYVRLGGGVKEIDFVEKRERRRKKCVLTYLKAYPS